MPQRYSEVTAVYRQEKAGELMGLSRVYMLTQDDAHVFCTEDQAIEESLNVYKIIKDFYAAFDFGVSMKVRLSLRDPSKPEKYLGDEAIWKKSEDMMRTVAKTAGLEIFEGIGEAAFYAPKLDFMAYDSLGREWQLATIQLDLNFADRFNLKYIEKDGSEQKPVIIHRAILGSVERFMSILIEHYAGAFPIWLSPVQVTLLPISEHELDYAKSVQTALKVEGIRVELDETNSTLGKKMVNARNMKVPYMAIIGKQEVENKTITLKNRAGEQITLTLAEVIAKLKQEIISKV
jgi:threonyl-tRNA synthetase